MGVRDVYEAESEVASLRNGLFAPAIHPKNLIAEMADRTSHMRALRASASPRRQFAARIMLRSFDRVVVKSTTSPRAGCRAKILTATNRD